jgi:hypothetical protein
MHLGLRSACRVVGVLGALSVTALSAIPANAESVAPAHTARPADTFTLLDSTSSGVCGPSSCQFVEIRLWQDNQTGGRHGELFGATGGTVWLQSGSTRFGVTNSGSGQDVNTPVGFGDWAACGFARVGSVVGPTSCTAIPL